MAYHLERGGLPLNNMVEANCKKGAITDNKCKCLIYGLEVNVECWVIVKPMILSIDMVCGRC